MTNIRSNMIFVYGFGVMHECLLQKNVSKLFLKVFWVWWMTDGVANHSDLKRTLLLYYFEENFWFCVSPQNGYECFGFDFVKYGR